MSSDQPKRIRSAARNLLKEKPSEETIVEIVTTLLSRDDHSAVILAAAYVESMLEDYIKSRLRCLSREDENRMFEPGQNGFLSSFSAKIRLAYAMRLFGFMTYCDLQLITDIRNVVAHSLHKIDFQHELIAKDCTNLQILRQTHHSRSKIMSMLHREIRPFPESSKEVFCVTAAGLWWTMHTLVNYNKDDFPDRDDIPFEIEFDKNFYLFF